MGHGPRRLSSSHGGGRCGRDAQQRQRLRPLRALFGPLRMANARRRPNRLGAPNQRPAACPRASRCAPSRSAIGPSQRHSARHQNADPRKLSQVRPLRTARGLGLRYQSHRHHCFSPQAQCPLHRGFPHCALDQGAITALPLAGGGHPAKVGQYARRYTRRSPPKHRPA